MNKILAIGDKVDRYGAEGGRYVAMQEEGKAASYSSRSMPFVKGSQEYREYEVTGDLSRTGLERAADALPGGGPKDEILAAIRIYGGKTFQGSAAPAFGGSGGALQVELPLSVDALKTLGVIKDYAK